MRQFQFVDPAGRGEVLLNILDPLRGEGVDHREVELIFLCDGRRFTTLARVEAERPGRTAGQIMVQDLRPESVLAAVREILQRGAVEGVFTLVPED